MSDVRDHVLSIIKDLEGGFEGDIYDYLQDVLDIEYIVNSKKEFVGARVLATSGGPNIWIDTRRSVVEGYWYGDYFKSEFDDEIGLNDAIRELCFC